MWLPHLLHTLSPVSIAILGSIDGVLLGICVVFAETLETLVSILPKFILIVVLILLSSVFCYAFLVVRAVFMAASLVSKAPTSFASFTTNFHCHALVNCWDVARNLWSNRRSTRNSLFDILPEFILIAEVIIVLLCSVRMNECLTFYPCFPVKII